MSKCHKKKSYNRAFLSRLYEIILRVYKMRLTESFYSIHALHTLAEGGGKYYNHKSNDWYILYTHQQNVYQIWHSGKPQLPSDYGAGQNHNEQ